MKAHVPAWPWMATVLFLVAGSFQAVAQEGGGAPPTDAISEVEAARVFGAIEAAGGYRDLLDLVEKNEALIGSPRIVELADAYLQTPDLADGQRFLLNLERQLSLDCHELGARTAVNRMSVRVIAASAMSADSAGQLAAVLEKFSDLSPQMSPQLVQESLDLPGSSWPAPLIPLMAQLAMDWPKYGALEAADRMAAAAKADGSVASPTGAAAEPNTDGTAAPVATGAAEAGAAGGGPSLVGHWRCTRVLYERPQDDHLVLHPDGTAESWSVTADGSSPALGGRWTTTGNQLDLTWSNGDGGSRPYTFYEGQLVYPSVQGQRKFWDRIE